MVNLCQFMGGTGFRVSGSISTNQIALRVTTLADTGANGYVFCDTAKALEAIKYCGAKTKRLSSPIPVIDYAGRPGEDITHGIKLDLTLDGVMYPKTFMLITDCGSHDLLVGFHFFAQHEILLDPANRKLIQRLQETPSLGRLLTVQAPKTQDQHPQVPQQILARPIEGAKPTNLKSAQKKARGNIPQGPLDIALIGGPAFHRNIKQPGCEYGRLTIAELDAMITKKHLEEHPLDDEENLRLIQDKLPAEYAAFTDVFSKSASDTLAQHREGVDHKIRLTMPESTLTCNHLYKLSTQELQAAKKYITENLNKGFIAPSKDNPTGTQRRKTRQYIM